MLQKLLSVIKSIPSVLYYLCLVIIKVIGVATALLLVNPFLPFFGEIRKGWVNNGEKEAMEMFLPDWLYWYSTNHDNSLWGDEAHRGRHAKFTGYWAQVCWVYRNPFKGADWTLLGAPVVQKNIEKTNSGFKMGLYFQTILKGNFVFGWLLDASYGDRVPDKKAAFVFGR